MKTLPTTCPPDVRKKMEGFATFWLKDGSVHRIKRMYLPDFLNKVMDAKPGQKLSVGAMVVRDAVKSRGAGRLVELLHACMPTEQEKQTWLKQ